MQYRELVRRIAFDASMLASGLLDLRSCAASKVAAVAGIACALLQVELIPDRIPVVADFDAAGYIVIGLLAAALLVPPQFENQFRHLAEGRPGLEPGNPAASWLHLDRKDLWAAAVRLAVLQSLASIVAKPLLRLTIGRRPRTDEVTAFCGSFARSAPVPPLLRGLASVPAAREQLMRTMLTSWIRADTGVRNRLKEDLGSVASGGGDQVEVWLGRPVAFLHLEKTAGMSVASFLTSRFHPLQIDPDPDRNCPPHVKRPFPPHLVERIKRYPLVWGHYDLPSIRTLGDARFVLTFLREPQARILSAYWYWRSHGSLYLGRRGGNECVLAAQRCSLLEFLHTNDPIVRNYLDNLYVRRLTGLYADSSGDPVMADPEGSLRTALDALDTVDFVGLTEDLDGSLSALARLLGSDPPREAPRVNVTRRGKAGVGSRGGGMPEATSVAVAEQLKWLTRLDCRVYETARERFRVVADTNAR